MNINNGYYSEIRELIYKNINASMLATLTRDGLSAQIKIAVDDIISDRYPVSAITRSKYVRDLVDELLGFGPIDALMKDDSISDIMINGHKNIFVERNGVLFKSEVTFINEMQLLSIAKRFASQVGRRVDEMSPTCDARMVDGSRLNIVIPPISLVGTVLSIRKYKSNPINFDKLLTFGAMDSNMANFLKIASRCRLNIVISGGTGSGKTSLLGALSEFIAEDERIITIEDAAELNLIQDHVISLETRPASIENTGAITARDLVINALRMRPDRIIIGECRGGETLEMLQAMNTGHDGSMSTLHANTPKDALSRLESMAVMGSASLPIHLIRKMIVSSVDILIQVNRLPGGSRKITSISEVVGLEGETVVMNDIFSYKALSNDLTVENGSIFECKGLPRESIVYKKAAPYGLSDNLKSIFIE